MDGQIEQAIQRLTSKPLNKKMLAGFYGWSYHQLQEQLADHWKEMGKYKGGVFTPRQIRHIVTELGIPPKMPEKAE